MSSKPVVKSVGPKIPTAASGQSKGGKSDVKERIDAHAEVEVEERQTRWVALLIDDL